MKCDCVCVCVCVYNLLLNLPHLSNLTENSTEHNANGSWRETDDATIRVRLPDFLVLFVNFTRLGSVCFAQHSQSNERGRFPNVESWMILKTTTAKIALCNVDLNEALIRSRKAWL